MVFLKSNIEALQLITTIITIVVIVFGWFFTSSKNRKLQRKKLAIDLLSQNRFQKEWTDSLSVLLKVIRNDPNYDWESVAIKSYNKKVDKEIHKMHEAIRCVLNYFEFVSIAVLNEAADEDIIRWSYSFFYISIYTELKPYILKNRILLKEESLLANFEKLAIKWQNNTEHAKPT